MSRPTVPSVVQARGNLLAALLAAGENAGHFSALRQGQGATPGQARKLRQALGVRRGLRTFLGRQLDLEFRARNALAGFLEPGAVGAWSVDLQAAAKNAGTITATAAMAAPARAKAKDAGTMVKGRKPPPETLSNVPVLPRAATDALARKGATTAAAKPRTAASPAAKATT
jgi:hypothetical protein